MAGESEIVFRAFAALTFRKDMFNDMPLCVAQNSGQMQYSQYLWARRLTSRCTLAGTRFLVMRHRFESQLFD